MTAEQPRPVGPDAAPGPQPDPAPVLPVLGVMCREIEAGRRAAASLAGRFGGVELWGTPAPFDQTRYYEPEMGPGLWRLYCTFAALIAPEDLVEIKHVAWAVEQRTARRGQREVNLDPGYLDLHKVVLASFKSGPQKLYLGQGVWADLVLYFDSGAFGPLQWSFPDLKGGAHSGFFVDARRRYKQALRDRQRQGGGGRWPR